MTGIIYYDKLSWLEKLGFLKQRRKFDDLWWWTDKLSVLVQRMCSSGSRRNIDLDYEFYDNTTL